MNFQFGKNEEPLDLTKGGDAGSTNVVRPVPLTTPGAGTSLPKPPIVTAPVATPSSLPEPPKRVMPNIPARPTLATPARNVEHPPQQIATPTYTPVPEQAPTQEEWQNRNEQLQQQAPTGNFQPQPNSTPSFNPAPQQAQFSRPEEQNVSQQPVAPQIQMVDRKGRPIKIKEKPIKAAKSGKAPKKEKTKSAFTGDRRKVLFARIAVFGILGILIIAGLNSFLPKGSGLTVSDGPLIIQKVRENLGVTDFPTTAGEGVALGFSKSYLGFDPKNREARFNELLQYAPESVVANIDPRAATQAEIDAVNNASGGEETTPDTTDTETGTNEEGTVDPETGEEGVPDGTQQDGVDVGNPSVQVVTDGPYLVRSVMIQGGENAIFTTKTQVNGKTWIYMEIPMLYDATTGTLSVSGSPTFVKPLSTGTVPTEQYAPDWANDTEIVDAITDDITNYMKAWANSDTATLERLTVKQDGKNVATTSALTGLDGSVRFVKSEELLVENKPALSAESTSDEKTDFYNRQARITVSWMEPSSGLIYEQTYNLTIQYVNDDWFVQDIQNVATSEGQYKDHL